MLVISQSQYAAFEELSRTRFAAELAHYLESEYPALAAAVFPGDLTSFVLDRCRDAEGFGLRRQYLVAWYVDLVGQLGFEFPMRPQDRWALDILHSAAPGEFKLEALEDALDEGDELEPEADLVASEPDTEPDIDGTPELDL